MVLERGMVWLTWGGVYVFQGVLNEGVCRVVRRKVGDRDVASVTCVCEGGGG